MIVLTAISIVTVIGVVRTARTVVNDGFSRVPTRQF